MSSPLKILLLEDSQSDALLLRSQLGNVSEFEFAIEHAERVSQAKEMLGGTDYDAILLDLGLPDSSGQRTVALVRELTSQTPIVVLTGADDRDLMKAAIDLGADNFLVKGTADGNRIALGILAARNHRARKLTEQSEAGITFLTDLGLDLTARLKSGRISQSEALSELMLAIESQGNSDYRASVLLYDEKRGTLHLGAAPTLPNSYNEAIEGLKVGLGAGSCGTAVFCKHSIYVVDIETDPLWLNYRAIAHEHNLRACWSVPILDESENVLGTFALYYDERRSPSESEREFIHSAARTAAKIIKIANMSGHKGH